MVEKRDLMYEGKAKKVYSTTDAGLAWLEFKDDATAFDGRKKGVIANKGTLNASISAHIFRLLEAAGIPTHFVEVVSPKEMLVKRTSVIPVEFVVRNVTAGSLAERMGVEEGKKLSCPVLELYYKDDALHDPMINEYHIRAFNLAGEGKVAIAKERALRVNELLQGIFAAAGLLLVDFKLEFGIDGGGNVLLVDEISPDGCRLWDDRTGEKMDKDRFRRDLGKVEDAYEEVWRRLSGGGENLPG